MAAVVLPARAGRLLFVIDSERRSPNADDAASAIRRALADHSTWLIK
jgi:hypothetical protein